MGSYADYYRRASSSIGHISEKEAEEFGVDVGMAIAGGASVALMKNMGKGNLDLSIGGMKVPGDAVLAAGEGVAGLLMHNGALKSASLGAFGAAGNRFFDSIFAKALGSGTPAVAAAGDYAQLGFGATEHDQLIAAAKQIAHR